MNNKSSAVPERYRDLLKSVTIEVGPYIQTAVGLRGHVGYRWLCGRCGQLLQCNTAGAQSHVAKHLRAGDKQTHEMLIVREAK